MEERPGEAQPATRDREFEALRRELERVHALAADDGGRLLSAILHHSPHGIIIADTAGKLVLQNRAAERIWAGSASTRDVESWQQYRAFHPDGRAFEPSDWGMARCLATGEVIEARELRILRFDDTPGHLIASSAPLLAADGTLTGAITVFADVTSLRESEAEAERLRKDNARLYAEAETARARLQSLFSQAPAGIAVLRGAELRYELANEPYHQLLGARQLVGLTLHEAVPELARQGLLESFERVFRSGETFTAKELPVVLENSEHVPELRYFDTVHQTTHDVHGNIDGVSSFAFDVTAQVRTRLHSEALTAEVARSEARLRALVDATAAIVWTAEPSGAFVDVSPSWLTFTGQSPEEFVAGGFANAIHADDRDETLRAWSEAVAGERHYAASYRLRRRDGSYAHTLARGTPVRGADGKVVQYVGCNVDISEQRKAEASAREHAETLAQVNELGRMINAELDTQKVVQAVTDAATTLTGAQFGAFFYNVIDERNESYVLYTISGVPREAFSKFPMPRNTAIFSPTFTGSHIVRSDDITADPDYGKSAPYQGMPQGHLPVRSYLAVPVISRAGAVLGGIFLGHSERGVFVQKDENLVGGLAAQAAVAMDNARLFLDAELLIKRLEQSNRELDQFAYVASHDLKAPLRGMAHLAQWIEEDLGSAVTPDVREKLALLRGRAQRMEGLIQGILEFSRAGRAETAKPEAVDVHKLALEVAELLSPAAPARIELTHALPTLHTDRVSLQQVWMNLLSNALKHAARPDVVVRVSAELTDDVWTFGVADNGPGIAPAFHERVWGIFQTLAPRDKVESTGIGLAIVKKVVEARGGRVWIDSDEGRGATFYFTWPKPTIAGA